MRADLHCKFEDLDVIYDELSEKITEEIHNIQVKIDKHNYAKAQQYLEGFLGGCSNKINLDSQGFLITSEVVYHVMKDLQKKTFSAFSKFKRKKTVCYT
ncbi:hypothetical protein [Lysinibacillus sp. NPDC056232]|uniref:hypothetical protein n=1 Tax=Lysinibacillus sp. NPDC056232 TaxID=3345756 RepID=UPI0035D9DA5D